ncbi:MAG TPA: wax ester/triacylglycerol synthase domain-containing protein [Cryobacterium sp.]|nr:wax ester/triacylglycerol synthase domain-containing protein [Cryobacterium sp.]
MGAPNPIDRVSTDDLMSLATEHGSTPMQVGAVLMLDAPSGLDPEQAARLLARRLESVARLRQRLVTVPFGCGRPVWADDPAFDLAHHLTSVPCPAPGGEPAVLDLAATLITTPLPRDRPLWSATLVTDTAGTAVHGTAVHGTAVHQTAARQAALHEAAVHEAAAHETAVHEAAAHQAALIIVFHHVLADGIGGLAVLARLVDGAPAAADRAFSRPMPSALRLVTDAARGHLRSLRRLPATLTRIASAVTELRPNSRPRLAPTSLNRPTGARRRFLSIRVGLDHVRDVAHAHGATVNDVVLTVIGGALHRLLEQRGERLDRFVLSVPFSERRQTTAGELGNRSGIIPIEVPGVGDPAARLECVARVTRAAKRSPPGASTALLGPAFRLLARLGLFQRFVDRQRLIHTFVTNLRGPTRRETIFGCPITAIVPLSVATGNVTVSFSVLSYAGTLTLTLNADPDACTDLAALGHLLGEEIDALAG